MVDREDVEENDDVLDRPTNPDKEERSETTLSGDEVSDLSGACSTCLALKDGCDHAAGEGWGKHGLVSSEVVPERREVGGGREHFDAGNFSAFAIGQGRSIPLKRDAESRHLELDLDELDFHMLATSKRGVVCGVGKVPSTGGGGGMVLEAVEIGAASTGHETLPTCSMLGGFDKPRVEDGVSSCAYSITHSDGLFSSSGRGSAEVTFNCGMERRYCSVLREQRTTSVHKLWRLKVHQLRMV